MWIYLFLLSDLSISICSCAPLSLLAMTLNYVILVVALGFTVCIFNLPHSTFKWYFTSHIVNIRILQQYISISPSWSLCYFHHPFYFYLFCIPTVRCYYFCFKHYFQRDLNNKTQSLYIYLRSYHILCSSFLYVDPDFHLELFPSVWRISLNNSYSVGLLVMNSFSFHMN